MMIGANMKIRECIINCAMVCVCSYLKSVLRCEFLFLDTKSSGHYIYVRKDVRIRGYCSKPKGCPREKHLGNNGLRGITLKLLYFYVNAVHIDQLMFIIIIPSYTLL